MKTVPDEEEGSDDSEYVGEEEISRTDLVAPVVPSGSDAGSLIAVHSYQLFPELPQGLEPYTDRLRRHPTRCEVTHWRLNALDAEV